MKLVAVLGAIALTISTAHPVGAQVNTRTYLNQTISQIPRGHRLYRDANSSDQNIRSIALEEVAEYGISWCLAAENDRMLMSFLSLAMRDTLAVITSRNAFRYICPEKRDRYLELVNLLYQVEGDVVRYD